MNDPMKNLSGQDIEHLIIELYRSERCLWDSSDADYLDADLRQAALRRIATELGRLEAQQLVGRWHVIVLNIIIILSFRAYLF